MKSEVDTGGDPVVIPLLPEGTRALLLPVWRRRLLIAAFTAVSGAASGLNSATRAPLFEATAKAYVNTSILSTQPELVLFEELGPLMASRAVATAVIGEMQWTGWSPDELLRTVAVRPVPSTRYIEIVARASRPEQAVPLARTFARFAVLAANEAGKASFNADDAKLREGIRVAAASLARTAKAIDDFRFTSQITLLERKAQSVLQQRAKLVELELEMKRQRSTLTQLESATATPPLAGTGGSANQRDLAARAAELHGAIAILERDIGRAAVLSDDLGSESSVVRKFYEAKAALGQLDYEHRAAERTFEDVVSAYQETVAKRLAQVPSLAVVSLDAEPRLIASAGRDVIFGAAAGFLFAVAGLIVVDAGRRHFKPR